MMPASGWGVWLNKELTGPILILFRPRDISSVPYSENPHVSFHELLISVTVHKCVFETSQSAGSKVSEYCIVGDIL